MAGAAPVTALPTAASPSAPPSLRQLCIAQLSRPGVLERHRGLGCTNIPQEAYADVIRTILRDSTRGAARLRRMWAEMCCWESDGGLESPMPATLWRERLVADIPAPLMNAVVGRSPELLRLCVHELRAALAARMNGDAETLARDLERYRVVRRAIVADGGNLLRELRDARAQALNDVRPARATAVAWTGEAQLRGAIARRIETTIRRWEHVLATSTTDASASDASAATTTTTTTWRAAYLACRAAIRSGEALELMATKDVVVVVPPRGDDRRRRGVSGGGARKDASRRGDKPLRGDKHKRARVRGGAPMHRRTIRRSVGHGFSCSCSKCT